MVWEVLSLGKHVHRLLYPDIVGDAPMGGARSNGDGEEGCMGHPTENRTDVLSSRGREAGGGCGTWDQGDKLAPGKPSLFQRKMGCK